MCMISDEFVEMLRQEWRRARKVHRCMECYREIGIGERYLSETWVFDGRLDSWKTCQHCVFIARPWLQHNCQGFIFGAVFEDIFEHFPGGSDDSDLNVGRILVGMRRKWRRRDGDLMPVTVGANHPETKYRGWVEAE